MICQDMSTEKIKNFLRAMYKVKKGEIKREQNRKNISSHINKIKKITLSKKFNKMTIEDEFKKLEDNVNNALEKEKKIIEEQKHGSDMITVLKNRLDRIEKKIEMEREKKE